MVASSAVEYLPLWQSLVGALGAFAVAAFTVWRSNKHAYDREQQQARRAKNSDKLKVLRERLESVVAACESAFDGMRGINDHALQTMAAVKRKGGKAPNFAHERNVGTDVSTAVSIARIYFPSMADPVSAFFRELSLYSKTIAAAIDVAITDGSLEPVVPADVMTKTKAARFAVLDEARRLIESDFNLKDG